MSELADRASLALTMFTSEVPDRSLLVRWARESLADDQERFLQVHPFPKSQPGLVVMYQPLNDDLLLMDLGSLHRPPPVKLSKGPVVPELGVGEHKAYSIMTSILDELTQKGLIEKGHSEASAELGVWKERSRANGLSAEWAMEYQWTMNRIVDGVEFIDAGVRIGIHHEGHLSSLRITDVDISTVPNSSQPVTVDLPRARTVLITEEAYENPEGVVHVDQERLAVILDPGAPRQTLTPGILFNYSLRFEVPRTNTANVSRQILTSVDVTDTSLRHVFPTTP